ncbi:uncharacterized protein [Nicotiana tomentosiformis]|uniref:uncharacterized protein n=1 Tax=Nicotiana tomentosiformis TaxID=4098 RepID=UPI00388C6078
MDPVEDPIIVEQGEVLTVEPTPVDFMSAPDFLEVMGQMLRCIPPSQIEELRFKFEQLQRGQMTVTDYEARFSELSRHALMILPTEAERVQRFFAGLHSGIQVTIAREVEMGTSYQLVMEIAWRIEGYHQRGQAQMSRDKQFCYSGGFSGAMFGGSSQFKRGQSSMPTYPSPPPPWDALV